MKPGIVVDIPGFGRLELRTLVSDYTGTLSCGGKITRGIERRLALLAESVNIHIVTADTLGSAERELGTLPLQLHRLAPEAQDVQKMSIVETLDPHYVVTLGNGANDRLLLQTVRKAGGLAVAVDNGEGCAVETLQNANLFITDAENALDLLIEINRLKATLRF